MNKMPFLQHCGFLLKSLPYFVRTKLKLLPFNEQVETTFYVSYRVDQLWHAFLNKTNQFLKLPVNYDGDNDALSKGSIGLSRPSSQENVKVMLKQIISKL